MERETGIEPATNSLEGCDSTTELLPPTRSPARLPSTDFNVLVRTYVPKQPPAMLARGRSDWGARCRARPRLASRHALRTGAHRCGRRVGRGREAAKADVAQLAERVLGKDEVTSSILVIGSSSHHYRVETYAAIASEDGTDDEDR